MSCVKFAVTAAAAVFTLVATTPHHVYWMTQENVRRDSLKSEVMPVTNESVWSMAAFYYII